MLNPKSPTFVQDLYKTLGFAFIESRLKRYATELSEKLDDLLNDLNEPDFEDDIDKIKKLPKVQRNRATLAFIVRNSNVLDKNKQM